MFEMSRDLYNHNWDRQTNYKLNKFDLLSIDEMQSTVSDVHEENLLLAGLDAIWLSRKTTGIKCRCWDKDSDQPRYYKCSLCYGVGWTDGYDAPQDIKISYTPGKEQININIPGLAIDLKPSIWTKKTSPPIKERDIIIFKNDVFGSKAGNIRYYVASAEESILADDTRYQEVILSYPETDTDVIWDIPVAGASGGFYEDLEVSINIGPIYTDLNCAIVLRNPWWADD